MKTHLRVLLGLVLCLSVSQPVTAADFFSSVLDSVQNIANALTRPVTQNATPVLANVSRFEVIAQNLGEGVWLDWSGYWEEKSSTFNNFMVYRSPDQKNWELIATTKFSSLTDTKPYSVTTYYKVSAKYSDHTVKSLVASIIPDNNFSAVAYTPVSVAPAQVGSQVNADKILEVNYFFDSPVFMDSGDGYVRMQVSGLTDEGAPGTPLIPYRTGHILIPEGYKVASVEYENLDTKLYQDKLLAPGQPPVPIGFGGPAPVSADAAAYASNVPNESLKAHPVQYLAGYELLPILLTPVAYSAADKKVVYARHVRVRVNLQSGHVVQKSSIHPSSIKQITAANDAVKLLIDNKEDLGAQTTIKKSSVSMSSVSSAYDMLIIAPQSFAASYQPFIDFKNSMGVKSVFVSTEAIFSSQAGRDNAEKIKNYIKSYYMSYGIQYVLIGADVELVPTRKLPSYCPAYGGPDDGNMNTDVYYSCLDDNWDPNNNGVYAEKGETFDRYAEVAVGRFPASNAGEVTNMVNKTIKFQTIDPTSPFIKNVMVFGENLDSNTMGSYYTSYISPSLSGKYNVTTYADDKTYWSGQTLVNALSNNSGQLMTHMGHSNYNYNGRLYTADVSAINNTLPYIYYTGGCFPNYFVYSDSISEAHMTGARGAVAFIGNSHYGWYYPGRGDGPSARLAYDFNTAVTARNINQLGRAIENVRERDMGAWGYNDGFNCDRLLFFAINLLGDPSVTMVTDFSPKKGVAIKNAFHSWEKGLVSVQVDAVGTTVQSLGLYYRLSDADAWKTLQSVNNTTLTYVLDTSVYSDTATFQLKAIAAYPDGPVETPVSTFGIDNNVPQSYTQVTPKVYNTDVTMNIVTVDAGSGVDKTWFSVGDLKNQQYLGPIILSQGGDYLLSFSSMDKAGNVQPTVSVAFSIDKASRVGFPIQLGGAIYGVPTYKDIDGDGFLEIAVQSNDGRVYLFNHDGTSFTGWENGKYVGVKGAASPAIADVDRDGKDEIIVFGSFNGLSVYKLDGTLKWQALASGLSNNSSPVIADINNDGSPDILLAADGKLYALDGLTGTILPGFPVSLAGGQSLDIFGTPAVADLDGDGKLEIALAFSDDVSSYFKVYNSTGSLLWSKSTSARWMTSSPVIGDINNDGKPEVVFAGGEEPRVYAFDATGNSLPGFPFNAGSGHFAFSPVLTDLNNDGNLEIILPLMNPGQNKLYAIRSDGTSYSGFPFDAGAEMSSGLAIGDVDGDGNPDLVVGGNKNEIHAYTLAGNEIAGFPKKLSGTMGLSPVLLDLEGDGKTDILAGDWTGKLSAWKTDGIYSLATIPWGTFAHDTYHTGFYQTVFMEEPAVYKKTSGPVPIKIKTFNNGGWITNVLFEYSEDSTNGVNGTWQKMIGISSQINQFLWDSMPKNAQKDVWVRARCLTRDGAYSGYVSRKLFIDNLPAANVTNFKVTDPVDNGEKLNLTWTRSADDGAGNNDLVNYTLCWNDGSGETRITLPRGSTAYSVTTDKSKAYTFYLKTYDGSSYNQSQTLGPVTPGDEIPPDQVYGVAVTDVAGDNGGASQVKWNHSTSFKWDDPVVTYKVSRALNGSGNWQLLAIDLRDNKLVDSTATLNQVFDYKVTVTDRTWNVDSAVVTGASRDDLPPALPVSIAVYDVPLDNGEAVIANWSRSSDDGGGANDLVKYIVYNNQTAVELPAGSITYTFTGLQKNTLCLFYLETVDKSGNIARSSLLNCYSRDNLAPQVPTFSVSDVPNDQGTAVQLDFPKSSDDGSGSNDVTKYSIYRKGLSDSSNGVVILEVSADARAAYTLRDPVSWSYLYRLAVTDGDNFAYGNWVMGLPVDNMAPIAPAGFTATDNPGDNGGSILLNWTKSADDGAGAKDVLVYNIYRMDGSSVTWSAVAGLPAGSTSYLDTGLINGNLYTYRLEVRDKVNGTVIVLPYSVTPVDNIAPAKVQGFTAIDSPLDNGGRTLLSWIKNTDDTVAYYIYRDNQFVASVNAIVSSFNDNVPQDNVVYSYSISAFDGTLFTKSDVATASALDNLVTPPLLGKVEDLAGDNGGSLVVSWTQILPEPNLQKYVLFRNGIALITLDKNILSWVDTNATKNVVFNYKIKAVDVFGNEAFSNEIAGKSIDNIPPSPVVLSGIDHPGDNGEGIDLSWRFDKYEADVKYTIIRNALPLFTFSTNTTNYIDTATFPNTNYLYQLIADDGTNVVSNNLVVVTAIDNTPPDFNGLITVADVPSDNGGVLSINWSASKAKDVSYYNIYRGVDAQNLMLITSVNSSGYADKVVNNQVYYYKVSALDGTFEVMSQPASAKAVDNIAPAKIQGFIVTDNTLDNGGTILLSWSKNLDDTQSYTVYRDSQFLVSLNAQTTSYLDSVPQDNVAYSYYVNSYDGTTYTRSDVKSASARDNLVNPPVLAKVEDIPGDNGGAVLLSWAQVSPEPNLVKYTVYRNGIALITLDKNILAWVDSTATKNMNFVYKIKAMDVFGNEAFSNEITGRSIDNIPPSAVNLSGKDHPGDNGDAIDLNWSFDKYEDEVNYTIFRNGLPLFVLSNSTINYTDKTVLPNGNYLYQIIADDGTYLVSSNLISLTALDNLPPDMARIIKVDDRPSDNGGILMISWPASTAVDLKGYKLLRSSDGSVFNQLATVNATTYTDQVVNNITYTYKVAAYDGTYETSSGPASGKAIDNIPPLAVSSLVVRDTAGDQGTSLTLSWTMPMEPGVTYKLYRNSVLYIDNLQAYSFVDTGLTKGTVYSYYLIADDGTYQVKSSVMTAAPMDDYVSPVINASAQDVPGDNGNALILSWQLPADSDLAKINIYRDNKFIIQLDKRALGYTDSTVFPGISYSYSIETVDLDNNKNTVNVSAAAMDNVAPEPATNLQVTDPVDNGGVLQLSWKKSGSPDVILYEVYHKTKDTQGLDGPWVKVATISATAVNMYLQETGLDIFTQYVYKVVAMDSVNKVDSNLSEPTQPRDEIVPGAVILTAVDNPDDNGGVISLSWTPSDADVVIYRIIRNGQEVAATTSCKFYDSIDRAKYEIIAQDLYGNQSRSKPSDWITSYSNIPALTLEDVIPDNGSQVRISWTNSDPAFIASSIARKTDNAASFVIIKNLTQESLFLDQGLSKNSSYWYRLTYRNITGVHYLDVGPITPIDENTPVAIIDLKATALPATSGQSVKLTWTKPVDTAIKWQDVYRSSGAGSWQLVTTLNISLSEFLDQSIVPYITYNFRVDTNTGLGSASGNVVAVRTYDDTVPIAPVVTDVPADRGTQLMVAWSITGISKLYKIVNGAKVLIPVSSTTNSRVISALSSDVSYQFSYAVNRDGHEIESLFSTAMSPLVNNFSSAPPAGLMAQDVYIDNGSSLLLLWSKSVDDGAGFNDVSFYRIYQDGRQIAQVNRGEFMYKVTGLLPDYKNPSGNLFKVSALNSYQVESFSNEVTASPKDELPPLIPIGFVVSTTSITNAYKLSWNVNPDDTRSYVIYRNNLKYSEVPVTVNSYLDSGLTYGTAYAYQVSAVDYAGNESARSVARVVTPVFTAVLKPGINLVSMPYLVSEARMSDSIPDPSLAVFNWTGAKYSTLDSPFKTGRSCFVKVNGEMTVLLNNPTKLVSDVTVQLSTGWNLIADPFINPLSLSAIKVQDGTTVYTMPQAVAAGLIAGKAFTLNDARNDYAETTVLAPFAGCWVKAFKNISIIYPYSVAAIKTSSVRNLQSSGWTLSVKAAGKSLVIGQDSSASDTYDGADAHVPPAIASLVDGSAALYIEHNNWNQYSGVFLSDIRKSEGSWTIILDATANGESAIELDGLAGLPADKVLVVTDKAGQKIKLNGNRFVVASMGVPAVFTIQVMSISEVFEVTSPVVYPNPCNINQTDLKIKFNSNKTGDGKIRFYGVNGREIFSEPFNIVLGDNIVVWDGRGNDGLKVGSGLYFYTMELTGIDGNTIKKKDKFAIFNR